mmetsp:Transcript_4289/g.9552  ORF Transcript_4289/g.9552 Transcript_4289/m.9552 type:complete len:107 (-) Transcript_4289:17-337(-)
MAVAVAEASPLDSPSGPRPMLTARAEERDKLRWSVRLDDEASDETDREGLERGVTNALQEEDDRTKTPINEQIGVDLIIKNFMIQEGSGYSALNNINVVCYYEVEC